MNKNLLDYKLVLEYYKDNNPFDRYIRVKEDNIILDNNILNILDNVNEFIYIIPFSKYKDMADEKDKEIERLNNIINKFEKLFKEELKDGRSENNKWLMGYYDASKDYLDKLKELKKKKENKYENYN